MLQFDEAFYLSQNPDVAQAVASGTIGSAEEHFNLFGFSEGRDPNPYFDTSFYLDQNPDVAAAGVNPLEHYTQHGEYEGRSPNPLFDPAYYAEQNPDVVAAGLGLFEHFITHGSEEGRAPSAPMASQLASGFDEEAYLAANPDVAAAVANGTFASGLEHWLQFGFQEDRPNAQNQIGEPLSLTGPGGTPDETPDGDQAPETPVGGGSGGGSGGGGPVNAAPTVSLTPVQTQIREDADTSVRTKVADIVITDDGLGNLSVELTGDDAALFEIDGTELFLKAGATLDFEQDAALDAAVTADDDTIGTTPDDQVAFSLAVEDINEAPISVSLENVVTELSETDATSPRIKIADIVVEDDALGTNTLAVTGADKDLFEIVDNTLYLIENTILDADASGGDALEFGVEVDDTAVGGTPDAQTALQTLIITDVNEAPEITSNDGGMTASIPVDENQTAVTTVTATDPDAADAGNLTYDIIGGADELLFEIDPNTGALTFAASPDFEDAQDDGADNTYDVTVEVRDTANNTDTQEISVTVQNVNEAPAAVVLAASETSLDEDTDTSARIKIADIAVTDDALGTETLGLTGADADKFEIVGNALFLKAGTALDADTDTSFEVAVTADDTTFGVTNSVEATSGTFTLTINNVNEAPEITSNGGGATASVNSNENQAAVTAVTATDPDAVDNGNLTYDIIGGADELLFEIDPNTGALTFAASPDFEDAQDDGADNTYDVTVEVRDTANNTDTQEISVTVQNVNEAPAAVVLAASETSLDEDTDTSARIKIADIAVTDDALGTETLGLTGADADKFEIVGNALFLKAGTALDADTDTSFEVAVTADDTTFGVTNSVEATSGTFTLTINNVNEAPEITSNGGGATASVNSNENQAAVTAVTATDPDAVDNGNLTYDIIGGADELLFEIDPNTGALTFAASPDFEDAQDDGADNTYDVIVEVEDTAGNTDRQTIAVTVADLDETPPPLLAVAFVDNNNDNLYNSDIDTMIAQISDTNRDGAMTLGDTVSFGRYPTNIANDPSGSVTYPINISDRTFFSMIASDHTGVYFEVFGGGRVGLFNNHDHISYNDPPFPSSAELSVQDGTGPGSADFVVINGTTVSSVGYRPSDDAYLDVLFY